VDDLIKALTSGDDEQAEATIPQIIARGTSIFPALTQLLSSTEPDHRWWALRAMSELDPPQVSALLVAALDDPDQSVRQCAALGLRLKPDPGGIEGLIESMQGHDLLLSSLAADALVAIGELAVPALLDVLSRGSPSTRLQAVRALALIGDKRAVPALFAALDDQSSLVQYWAENGLEKMGIGMTFFKP
jgi:HEAT repeat protein